MPDPVLLAIAAAVAAKGTEAAVEGGRGMLKTLVRLIRERVGRGTSGQVALDDAAAHPDDPRRHDALAAVLAEWVARDQEFGARLRECWAAVQVESGGVINRFTGTAAGPVIQARDIRGDITF